LLSTSVAQQSGAQGAWNLAVNSQGVGKPLLRLLKQSKESFWLSLRGLLRCDSNCLGGLFSPCYCVLPWLVNASAIPRRFPNLITGSVYLGGQVNLKIFKKLLDRSNLKSIAIDMDSSVINVEGH
jgi:hypothetical protein